MNITNFKLVYKDASYDRTSNPERRSVAELSPIAMTWEAFGENYRYDFEKSGSAVPLKHRDGIALVDISEKSRGLIIDPKKNILHEVRIKNIEKNTIINFYDVYYIDDVLYFFCNANNYDISAVFDEASMEVKSWRYIKY